MCKKIYIFSFLAGLFSFSCLDPSDKKDDTLILSVDTGWEDSSSSEDSGEVNAPDEGSDVGPVKTELIIVTYNVRRYFDDVCDSGRCDSGDYEHVFAESEYKFRGKQLADSLRDLDADIIVLEEIEKESGLKIIAEELSLSNRVFGETFFDGSLDVGIISKYKITKTTKHRDKTTLKLSTGGTKKFTREFLESEIDVKGEKVFVFAAHFKSKSNDNPAWRAAEGKAATEIMEERAANNPNSLVVLGGDLNDIPGSDTLNFFVESGELALSEGESTWTYQFRGMKSQIDHLIYAKSSHVKLKEVKAIRDNSGSLGVSDHSALRAVFELR